MIKEEKNRHQITMFSSLDDFVSPDSEVRGIDLIVNDILITHGLNYQNGKGKSLTGRPAYSFGTMLKLFIYGYINRICSSRNLERECHRNVELMWLIGHQTPDHCTIYQFRNSYSKEISAFNKQFRHRLQELGLFSGKYAIDGSKFKANLNPDKIHTLKRLEMRYSEITSSIEYYLSKLDKPTDLSLLDRIDLKSKQVYLEEELARVKELIDYAKQTGKTKDINLIDPDAKIMKSRNGFKACHNIQIATDTETKFIAADFVSGDCVDVHLLEPVVDEINKEVGTSANEVVADKGYFCFKDIESIETNTNTKCYVAIPKESSNKSDFIYDSLNDCYICPQGKLLTLHNTSKSSRTGDLVKSYLCRECEHCPVKDRCTTSTRGRSIERYHNEDMRINFRKRMKLYYAKQMMIKRKSTVECIFGTIKIRAGKIPLLTHGHKRVKTEIKLHCLAYNVKHLINMFELKKISALLTKSNCRNLFVACYLYLSEIINNKTKYFRKIFNFLQKRRKFECILIRVFKQSGPCRLYTPNKIQ